LIRLLFGILMTLVSLNNWTRTATAQEQQHVKLANRMLGELRSKKGLCVVVGSQDGALAVALSRDGDYLVHGLCTSNESVGRARQAVEKAGLRGVVSAETGTLNRLPYSDNIVNLVVVENLPTALREGLQLKEVLRVLRPGGEAWFEGPLDGKLVSEQLAALKVDVIGDADGVWYRFHKPRPKEMGEWTHPRGNASGNPVSSDTLVGVPTGVRWIAGPIWPTGDRKASVPTAVASSRHLACVFEDEVSTSKGMKREKSLIVRDAYNGLRLWRRKADSAEVIAAGGRIYTKIGRKLVALDGETGDVAHTFDVASPGEFLLVDGLLLVATSKEISAFDIENGQRRWSVSRVSKKMRVGDGQLFVHVDNSRRGGDSQLVCFQIQTGKQLWEASTKSWSKEGTFDLIFYREGVLVAASKKANHGVSAKDGSHLWDYTYPLIGHGGSYAKVMASGGLVWIHTADSQGTKQYAWEGLDLQSGQVKKRLLQPKEFKYKHRCSYDVATEQLFLCGSMDFANLETGEYDHFGASRTSCRTAGLVPANGLIYTFPHACGCYAMLRGFIALETRPQTETKPQTGEPPNERQIAVRLEKGPRYGVKRATSANSSMNWPTWRHDVSRSGSTRAAGPEQLAEIWNHRFTDVVPKSVGLAWEHKDGGSFSSPVVADGLVFIASSDQHRLSALDADSGEPRWNFTTGGRIDCPPTIDGGLCLFGSRDGWVYCLTADDGQLVWRFRAAPFNRKIVAYGQIESARPVMGGVLVYDGLAYFVAGRHSASDGGLLVQAVSPETGELVWAERVTGHDGLPDVLTGGKGTIQMAGWEVDAKTGKKKSAGEKRLRGGRLGLLNDAWYKRPIAIRRNFSDWKAGSRPTGQMLAFNASATSVYRACEKVNSGNGAMSGNASLFTQPVSGKEWKIQMPTTARIRGMVLAGDRLYVAGLLYQDEKGKGASHGVRVYNSTNGKQLAEHVIKDALVHDCLAIAGGRLYVSTQRGRVICLGTK
jgi:outer membrane protein assembly factor BamB